jgi:hypothetical protein
MNVFGAFTFGALIKTFLPGFVWLTALVIGETQLASAMGWPSVWTFIDKHESLAAVLAIPASILLGLISNILVFMGVNDSLVRKPARRNDESLFGLHDAQSNQMKVKCWASINCVDGTDGKMERAFTEHVDPELLMLHKIGVNTLAYIREQYWFHLEFQMNLLMSFCGIAFAMCFYLYKIHGVTGVLATVFGVSLVGSFLVSAARKNYRRHIAKMASMMAAVLCPPSPETPPPIKS